MIEDPGNDILVSAASLWVIVVKMRVGTLEAEIAEVAAAVRHDGFALFGISIAYLAAPAALPTLQRDPFDHLLVAQAIVEDATFLSDDRNVAVIRPGSPPVRMRRR